MRITRPYKIEQGDREIIYADFMFFGRTSIVESNKRPLDRIDCLNLTFIRMNRCILSVFGKLRLVYSADSDSSIDVVYTIHNSFYTLNQFFFSYYFLGNSVYDRQKSRPRVSSNPIVLRHPLNFQRYTNATFLEKR